MLVAGLLLVGSVAAADGLFEAVAARLANARVGAHGLLLGLLALVAVVTALLNLDTSVVFLTPVLVHAARRRGLDERPFLYGSVMMANAASLLLPGSNLTNMLVLHGGTQGGATFAARMLPSWLVACTITAVAVIAAYRLEERPARLMAAPRLGLGLGAVATVVTGALVVALREPALPVLAVGLVVTALRRLRPAVDVRPLVLLFAFAVGLGTVARLWTGPSELVASSGAWSTALIGTGASLLLNNLPAAVLLSAHPAAHPEALLLGLDVGPNLAVSGSLSAVLWLQAARAVGARPSLRTYSQLGLVLVPATIATALAV